MFVTNQHFLVQFGPGKTPKKDEQGCVEASEEKSTSLSTVILTSNGQIVPQSKKVQHYLDAEIVGESDLTYGCRYILTTIRG